MNVENISEKLKNLMRGKNYVPRTVHEIASELGLDRRDVLKLKKILFDMAKNGEVARVKGDRYGALEELGGDGVDREGDDERADAAVGEHEPRDHDHEQRVSLAHEVQHAARDARRGAGVAHDAPKDGSEGKQQEPAPHKGRHVAHIALVDGGEDVHPIGEDDDERGDERDHHHVPAAPDEGDDGDDGEDESGDAEHGGSNLQSLKAPASVRAVS